MSPIGSFLGMCSPYIKHALYSALAVMNSTDTDYAVITIMPVLIRLEGLQWTSLNGLTAFSHFLFMPMKGSPCMPLENFGLKPVSIDELSDAHLTFLWPSDEDTGPVVRVGFRFLGRPGPLLAGLRSVSSFLLAHTDANSTQTERNSEILHLCKNLTVAAAKKIKIKKIHEWSLKVSSCSSSFEISE